MNEMMNEFTNDLMDNMLIAQKNEIIENINDGLFDTAKTKIEFVSTLWFAMNYSYKTQELLRRLELAMAEKDTTSIF